MREISYRKVALNTLWSVPVIIAMAIGGKAESGNYIPPKPVPKKYFIPESKPSETIPNPLPVDPPKSNVPNYSSKLARVSATSVPVHLESPSRDSDLDIPLGTELKSPGDLLVKSAISLYDEFGDLPYVWGGESPKPFEETREDPFFKGVSVTKTQPSGSWRAGQPTKPGFDCAGYVWYAGKRAGLRPFTDVRASANGYFRHKSGKTILPPKKYSEQEIDDAAEPGDILFLVNGRGKAYHIMIYAGKKGGPGYLLESNTREQPDYDNISAESWNEWRSYAGRSDIWRGGIQKTPLTRYSGKRIAIKRFSN